MNEGWIIRILNAFLNPCRPRGAWPGADNRAWKPPSGRRQR